MKITELSASNFRNLRDFSLQAHEKVNVICGENAQGKTNILEALWLFTGMRSFRGAKDKEMTAFGADGYDLKVNFESTEREQEAEIGFSDRKKITLNGVKEENFKRLSERYKTVVFSPAHLSLVKGGPAERRNFLDSSLYGIKSGYGNLLYEYNRYLAQRNAVLKDIRTSPSSKLLLDMLDDKVSKLGAKVISQRKIYICNIRPIVEEVFAGISDGKEKISIRYSVYEDAYCEDEIATRLREVLIILRDSDIENQSTSRGPHRDDLLIEINGVSARTYASQGQQRSCALALKIAEAKILKKMTKISPVILLDDVMSELDAKRQSYVFNNIEDNQVFITTCEPTDLLKNGNGKIFRIEDGKLI